MQNIGISTPPFDMFLFTLENEIRTLKSMVNLSSITDEPCSRESTSRLEQVENSLAQLEERLQDIDSEVEIEFRNLSILQSLTREISFQGKDFDIMVKNAPSFLFHNAMQEDPCERQENAVTNLEIKKLKTISTEEFELVPKSTRGRLSLSQINDALKTFCDKMEQKQEVTQWLSLMKILY